VKKTKNDGTDCEKEKKRKEKKRKKRKKNLGLQLTNGGVHPGK